METKLSAVQPPEGDALVQQTAAPPVQHVAGDGSIAGEVVTPRLRVRADCQIAAQASALEAYDRAERRALDGGGTEDEAADAIKALVPVTVLLSARHHEYLAMRAGLFGEPPGAHLERILREFRSYHDDKRPELTAMEAQRNGGAVTRRVA